MAVARKPLTGVRLSELAKCPRCCACRAIGCEPALPSDRQARLMNRGRVLGRMVADEFAKKHGADAVEYEREIVWPLGVGHADIYLKPDRLLIEVFSTSGSDYTAKIKQAKRYLHFDQEAEAAAVYVLNVTDLSREEVFPVFLTDQDREEIEAEVAAVQAAIDGTGPLPECVHSSPDGCRYSGCPFTASAWDGWTPPDPVDLSDSRALVAGAAELYQAKKVLAERKAMVEDAQRVYDDAKAALVDVLPVVGVEMKAGPLSVKRVLVKGRETLSWSKAKAALPDDTLGMLQPFVKVSDSYSRVDVRRMSDDPVTGEYGEVPF